MINKKILKVWFFQSKSNPNKEYETRQYEDGTTSCQCGAWCKHPNDDGTRTCPHVRMIETGTATQNSIRSGDTAGGWHTPQPAAVPQPEIQTVVKPRLVLKWKPREPAHAC